MTSHLTPDPESRPSDAKPMNGRGHVLDVAALIGLRARLGHWRVRVGDSEPVPVTVWRINPPAQRLRLSQPTLPGATARCLITLYSRTVDLVADADADPTLADAAGAASRRYQPVDLDGGDAAGYAGTAKLVVMQWPRTNTATGGTTTTRLAACERILMATGTLVAVLTPGDVAAGQADDLIHGACNAKLVPRRLLAVASRHPRSGTHRRTAARPTVERPNRPRTAPGRSRLQLELLLIVLRKDGRV